ncbi:MAG: molybdopterin-dependent oxidoreductase [Planctomycetota bacterium]
MAAEVRRTACSRDCPDACGILATVDGGRVTALAGDPEHPVTRGFLCFRTSRYPELQHGPTRVRQPLLRRGGRLEPVTLDEALDEAARRLLAIRAESGPAAIFHYRSGGSLGILKHLGDLFFEQFGPCATKVGDICSGAGEAAQLADFGTSDSNALFDLHHSRHILLWGKNPTVSSVHLVPVLKAARARGARLALIDPVHHKAAGLCDAVLQPRPGSDFELAMGAARALFDRGRIDPGAASFCDGLEAFERLAHTHTVAEWAAAADLAAADVEFVADCLADGPTAILIGWGLQRRQRGGATVRALDALCALSGNLFRPGGGCSFYFKRRKAFAPFGPEVAPPRTIREPLLAADLLAAKDPPVRAMWVTAGNPVAMLPDSAAVARALEQLDFLVVADCFLTETAARADLVLPVPSLLEDDDLLGSYGHHWISESRPVVDPPPGVVHEVVMLQQLARRVGLDAFPQDPIDDLKRRALRRVAPRGAGLEALRAAGGTLRSPDSGPLLFPHGWVDTPNGRVQLLDRAPAPAEVAAPPALAGGSAPLWLFSNSTEKSQASIWAGHGLGARAWVRIHPDALPGSRPGQPVRIRSGTGELEAELQHDPHQRRDVAIVPKGGAFDRGHAANALVSARATDLGLGAAYLDCMVRIGPL